MKAYITLLRGINVSGSKMIKMDALRALFEEIGCKNVKTYIQSGNVVFRSVKDAGYLQRAIQENIFNSHGFDVPVWVLNPEDIQKALDENPFLKRECMEREKLYFTFLDKVPDIALLEKLKQYKKPEEEFYCLDKAIHLYLPTGYGKTKLDNNSIENKLKVKATTRNLKTLETLANMAKEVAAGC
jgi:uncharacterized protein (DUF1697 family)